MGARIFAGRIAPDVGTSNRARCDTDGKPGNATSGRGDPGRARGGPASGTGRRRRPRFLVGAAALLTAGSVLVPVILSSASAEAAPPNTFVQTNLVASKASFHPSLVDPNLTNAWGIALGKSTPIWISDNDSDVATVYSGGVAGSPVSLDLTVPVPGGDPTGQVFNPTLAMKPSKQAFPVGGSGGAPAAFIVDTEAVGQQGPAGEIEAWNQSQSAFVVEDGPMGGPGGTTEPGALFFGLAVTPRSSHGPLLYAADGTNQSLDVFDRNFAPIDTTGMFTDPALGNYTPYNVQVLNGKVYVAYAQLNKHHTNIVAGAGKGIVDVYSVNGRLLHHLISNGTGSALNEPWGLAMAPKGFGPFAGKLLVGNLGNGKINAFNPSTGAPVGTLDNLHGKAIRIPGLWGLSEGNAVFGGSNSLVFTAGPRGYGAGLLGVINPAD
jgi:uncharacterized protein (TIGR03118 family)